VAEVAERVNELKGAERMNRQTEQPISEAFNAVVDLALSLGVRSIKDLPACWEHQVDEYWFIAINGHNAPKFARQTASGETEVPPFHCYIEFNGFPAGLITPYDGIIAAGSVANEDAFIAALKCATDKARGAAIL
jgi:hypothetical protein